MVEWKKLGDVCGIFDGTHQTPKYVDTGIKFVSVENINSLYESEKYISLEDYNEQYKTKPQKGDVLMTRIGDVGTCTVVDRDEPIAYYVSLALLKPNFNYVLGNYIKYILGCHIGKVELRKRTLLTAVPLKINLGDIGKICIPIPSLSEQTRIVGILDTFTDSIENLKQQIAERRKQYEFYRDQLISLERKEGVEMRTLGDVGEICMCKRIMKDQTSDKGDIPFFKIGTFGGKADAYIARSLFEEYKYKFSYPKKGEILISAAGTIGRSVVFDGKDAYFQDSNIVWIANDEALVTNRYLYYFYQIADWKTDGGTIKRLYNYNLKNTEIPVPSLSEQSSIVSILDTFEASIANLEAQLSQREKQYEYYRNKLLTFE